MINANMKCKYFGKSLKIFNPMYANNNAKMIAFIFRESGQYLLI